MSPRRAVARIVVVAVGLLLACAAGEVLARWSLPQQTFWPLHANVYRPLAGEIGYTFRPSYHGLAFGVELDTNGLGFRGPDWRRVKPVGGLRVALIGDSHAFGFGVSFADSVGEVLARLLSRRVGRPVEVLNFGVNGYNSRQELAVLRTMALVFDPDLIVVIASSNDHEPALSVDAQGWLHQQPVGDDPSGLSWLMRHSRLALFLDLRLRRYREGRVRRATAGEDASTQDWLAPFPPGPVAARLEATVYVPLTEMVRETRRRGVPIVVASFNAYLDYRQMFAVLAREERVPTLELLALFPEARSWKELQRRFSLGWDTHLNAEAHRRWAQGLAELIEREGYARRP